MSGPDSDRFRRIETILDRLFELDGETRERELVKLTEGDEDLRREVRALLDADTDRSEEFDSFLEAGAAPIAEEALGDRDDTVENVLPVGGRIGPYVLDRLLGSGGMSLVYLGRRSDGEFEQEVAIKVLRHPGRHPDLTRRFRIERQILAHLRHPNIARMLDGGLAEAGWPYLVMEHVDGVPLNEYCAQTNAPLSRRLELFDDVCAAVQHAHQRLVIHRDLKPSNILVTDEGQVKLLDFGIAKLLEDDEQAFEQTVPMTETGLRLFTPDYAAPEQIRGEPITTATDVYALGVLLYELLSGERPYRLKGRRASDIERIVCDEDPVPPSTTVARTGSADVKDTAVVDIGARQLRGMLRGDLDTICLKALQKEPDRRYASAQDLAADLGRYRDGLPVHARRATAGYRFSKFVRRNRLPVLAAAAAVVLSLGFGIFATVERGRTDRARARAEVQAAKATAVTDFMLGLFRASDPRADRPDTLSVRGLLERGVERVDTMRNQPLVQAEMLAVMGKAYREIRQLESAEGLFRRALAVHESLGVPDPAMYSVVLAQLGRTLTLQERHQEAIPVVEEVLDLRRELHGERHHGVAQALNQLGQAYLEFDRYAPAESLLVASLDLYRSGISDDPPGRMSVENNLASLYGYLGDMPRAAALAESVLVRQRLLLGDDHLDVALSLHNLAAYSRRLGNAPRAEALYRESLVIRRRLLPADHPSIATTLDNLAIAVGVQGRYDESEALFGESLDIRRRRFGDEHRQVASSYSNLTTLMLRRGNLERAVDYSQRAVATLRRVTTPPNASLANALRNLGSALLDSGRLEEARRATEEALEQHVLLTGDDSTVTAITRGNLAGIVLALGDAPAAEALRRRALSVFRETYGEIHPDVAADLHGLGAALDAQGRTAEADSAYAGALAIRTEIFGPDHDRTRLSADALEALRER